MNNEATSAIIEHLCNEARNSVHATFGVMDLLRDTVADPTLSASLEIGRTSSDQLLCSLDDFRDLLSTTPPPAGVMEEFDLALSVSQVIEALNLACRNPVRRITLESSAVPQPLVQDRIGVEQVLTRVLDCAFKVARSSEVTVSFLPPDIKNTVRLAIATRDLDLAPRLSGWLNADLSQTKLTEPGDIPYGVAMMATGKRLRSLGGSAGISDDETWGSAVTLVFPLQSRGVVSDLKEASSDTLDILVVEDCDDSFALSELMLQTERVQRAQGGRDALAILQKHRFDLVLMDIHMPEMDGYTAISGIREWETQTGNARTPIVILSSDDLDTQRQSAAQCGCSGFFRKPLRISELKKVLDRLKQARFHMA